MVYEKALKIATEAHKGQKRWNGDDYITHPIRIAERFFDDNLKSIAILHDVVEDTNITFDDLFFKYNINDDICSIIFLLTKQKNERYVDYITRIKISRIATLIKIADLKDNLQDLKKGHHRDKYELAMKILNE